jgi:hemolysin activation/secretion protein
LTLVLCLSAAVPLLAAPPDAGQLLREQQIQRQLPDQLPRSEAEHERQPMADTGERITIKDFVFTGYKGLASNDELQALVIGAVGKSLSFAELQGLVERVTSYLRGKGWFLARAYLPKQDVTAGIVEIAIVQGTSDGGIIIKRDNTVRLGESTIRGMADRAVRPGQPLNEGSLERSVLLMNDLPGVTAKASLAPGSAPGSTGVQIDVSEGSLLSGSFWGDNQGNRYTGTWRGNGLLNLNDPLRYGDQLTLLLTGAEGLKQGRVGYSLPLSSGGLRGNLSYTAMRYELTGDMAPLRSEGKSQVVGAGVGYPILRRRTANISANVSYEYKRLSDSAAGVETKSRTLHSGTLLLQGDLYDTLLGGGYTVWNAGVTTGRMQEGVADIGITNTEGGYRRFNLGLSRLQRVADGLSLNLLLSSQWALDNLDSSEKFGLGGPHGVRAYPIGEGYGDEGQILNVELHWDLPLPTKDMGLQLLGFYDVGHIRLYRTPWANAVSTATNKNDYWLEGAGMGFLYKYTEAMKLKVTWAHALGGNDGRSVAGQDSDGRSDSHRFWLQAIISF